MGISDHVILGLLQLPHLGDVSRRRGRGRARDSDRDRTSCMAKVQARVVGDRAGM